jgi:uncharacterized protein (TIGR03437 family)
MLSHQTLWNAGFLATLLLGPISGLSLAQVPPPSILRIDTQNAVLYVEDTGDVAKFATDPNVPTEASVKNFFRATAIADIVAVNGQAATGTHTRAAVNLGLRTAPTPGLAISDTVRSALATFTFEILKSDGTPIGTIIASGLAGGAAPPGSALAASGGNNLAIVGGTGAFLGVRGQLGAAAPAAGVAVQRPASITEDPANRRAHGGGTQQWIAHLIPMTRPEVVMIPTGPAIVHSNDFSPVNSSKRAAQGEILSIFATGLGPVTPGIDPGQKFPSTPLSAVNSPVEVTVNGKAAEILGAVGYPGTVDTYQVNFRLPPDTAAGLASIQITSAWISGSPVSIPVQ